VNRHATASCFLATVLLLPAALLAGGDYDKPDPARSLHAVRNMEPTFDVSAGVNGDVYPAFANYASLQGADQRKWGVVTVRISNPSDTDERYRIAVRVPGWSDQEVQIVKVASGSTRSLIFAPTFLPRLYNNREIVAATAQVKITDLAGNAIYDATTPVRLRAVQDMFWGERFKYAEFIASWVTPHDARVESILTKAKELMPGRRLPGYEEWKNAAGQEEETRLQARAIYDALRRHRLSYVKSSLTFGSNSSVSERIRTPRESIDASSANCIDGSVLFASAFENLGMDPVIVLVPGHAYVGVRLAEGSDRYLYIDSALTGRVRFEAAVNIAERGLAHYQPSQTNRIAISDARRAGIYPIPQLP
jgi:hypothetical protein